MSSSNTLAKNIKKNMKRINITLFALMLLGILFSCTKASINYTQNGNWVARATWPGTQMGYGVSFVVGNNSYVGLGINPVSPNARLVAFYKYTPTDYPLNLPSQSTKYDSLYGSWSQVAPFPGPARSNAVAFAVGGYGYVGTGVGNDGFTPLADFYYYNTGVNSWAQIDSLHDAVQSYPRFDAVAWGFDTVGYVLTGTDNNYYFGDVWKYSPQTGHWSQQTYLPGNPRSGAATWVYNGKGYLLTGYTPGSRWAQNNMCYDFWVFDPNATDSLKAWTRLRDIYNTSSGTYDDGYTNIIRKYGAAFIIKGTTTGDKGYITLGQNGTALTYTWEYDFLSDLWTEKTPYEGTARSGAVGFSITDKNGKSRGFAGTGLSTGNTSGFSDIEEFFPNQIYNQYD
jgi:N-acetylneuraminic acid mutarotase